MKQIGYWFDHMISWNTELIDMGFSCLVWIYLLGQDYNKIIINNLINFTLNQKKYWYEMNI